MTALAPIPLPETEIPYSEMPHLIPGGEESESDPDDDDPPPPLRPRRKPKTPQLNPPRVQFTLPPPPENSPVLPIPPQVSRLSTKKATALNPMKQNSKPCLQNKIGKKTDDKLLGKQLFHPRDDLSSFIPDHQLAPPNIYSK